MTYTYIFHVYKKDYPAFYTEMCPFQCRNVSISTHFYTFLEMDILFSFMDVHWQH